MSQPYGKTKSQTPFSPIAAMKLRVVAFTCEDAHEFLARSRQSGDGLEIVHSLHDLLMVIDAQKCDAVAFDPMAVRPDQYEDALGALRDRNCNVLVLTHLDSDSAPRILHAARVGFCELFLRDKDPEPAMLWESLRALPTHTAAGILFSQITDHLRELPVCVSDQMIPWFGRGDLPVSPAVLADNTGLRPRSIQRLFFRANLESPLLVISGVRAARALRPHYDSEAAMAQIFETAGYESASHARRHFRRFFGKTPSPSGDMLDASAAAYKILYAITRTGFSERK